LNAAELGLGTAIVNIAGIAVLGIIIGLIYWALDRLLSRKAA
jgi:fluoride ion exporter CrcB/FEX